MVHAASHLSSRGARRVRVGVFALSWLAYASYYIGRKQFAVSKASMASQYHLGTTALGNIDTGYLVAYSLGMFASGVLCDRIGPRRLVGFGMMASAAAVAAFGFSNATTWFALAFTANGFAQSTGWPGTIKAMTPWWSSSERGKVMGWWSTCYQVGGIAATAIATALLVRWGWRMAFWVPALWMTVVGAWVLLRLPEARQANAHGVDAHHANANASANASATGRGATRAGAAGGAADRAPSPRHVLRQMEVWYLGFIYFGFKLIRYSLLFWLPFYLEKQLGYSTGQAGYSSISFEAGGIVGTIGSGLLFDRLYHRRRHLILVMTFGLGLALVLYTKVAAWGIAVNFGAMAIVGFMLFGPDALISGAMAQELGGPSASGSTSGVINGIGSVGAIAQGTITALVATHYGWDRVFHLFIGLAFACSLALVPYAFGRRATPAPTGAATATAPREGARAAP
ncbi:MFS transporter [Pendulispora albinea]|uniref:MFS transporter n=1 Tax=Pendulispora albinea TaxID=2741071 RepID=A0ABZ2M0E4_9BACT